MMADDGEQLGLATELTIAWLSNAHTRAAAEDVSAMLGSVLSALRGLNAPSAAAPTESSAAPAYPPAVTARRSLASPDHIISMIDGTKHRSLTRYLRSNGLTPAEYRQRYGLKADYPMVAPGYSELRRAISRQYQLGRKAAAAAAPEQAAEVAPEPQSAAAPDPSAPAKRGRLGISGAKQAAKAHLGTDDTDAAVEAEPRSAPTDA